MDDDEHYAIFAGAFALLTKWNSWQKDGTTNAVDASNVWKEAMDMGFSDCCENAETRTVDGQTQYSPDGVNWYDYPGAMENPNFNNEPPYPDGTVPPGQDARCLTAENLLDSYKQFAQLTIDAIDALAGWVKLVAAIAAFMAIVMSGGFATAGAVAIAAAVLSLVDTWVEHSVDEDVLETIHCAIYCNVRTDGFFDPSRFQAMLDDISSGAPVLAPIINAYFGGFGPVGLNRLAAIHAITEGDCSDCDCSNSVEITYNFGSSGLSDVHLGDTFMISSAPRDGCHTIDFVIGDSVVMYNFRVLSLDGHTEQHCFPNQYVVGNAHDSTFSFPSDIVGTWLCLDYVSANSDTEFAMFVVIDSVCEE